METPYHIHPYILGLLHWVVSATSLMITSALIKNFKVGGFLSAMFIALFVGFANYFIKPFLLFLTLPLNIITLGLFTFVVNASMLRLCAAVLPNFEIESWGAAIAASIILAFINFALGLLFL